MKISWQAIIYKRTNTFPNSPKSTFGIGSFKPQLHLGQAIRQTIAGVHHNHDSFERYEDHYCYDSQCEVGVTQLIHP